VTLTNSSLKKTWEGDKQMIFKDLINIVNYDDVWVELRKGYKLKKSAYEVYKRVLEELKTLDPKPSDPPITCIVAKVEDCFAPGEIIPDVFGIMKGDKNHYALEMNSWNEWLDFDILDKSIEVYGAIDVVAHALYEITFFGYCSKTAYKKVEEGKHILDERTREIEDGSAGYVSIEEVMSDLKYVDKRTPKEKEKEHKECKQIAAKNKKFYEMLLGK
jgi:hypothetical protein